MKYMSTKQWIVSCIWYERTNMAGKCKKIMNCSKTSIAVKTNITFKWGIVKDQWCEGKNMAHKCKIFVILN